MGDLRFVLITFQFQFRKRFLLSPYDHDYPLHSYFLINMIDIHRSVGGDADVVTDLK